MDINQLKETIGRRLKQARKECDLTQDEVAERLGLSSVGYGSFERGANLIALNHLIEVSRILGKPLTYFLPTPYVTLEELNDLFHDPLFQDFLALWPRLDDEGRALLLQLAELSATRAERRGK